MTLSVVATAAHADGADTSAFARLGPIVLHGDEADNLLLGAGVFDLRDDPSGAGTVEYRFGRKLFVVGLALGLMANTDGGLFGYVGAYGDLSYKKIYMTPQLAIGGYREGDSQDLGGVFQFRQSIDLAIALTMVSASGSGQPTYRTQRSRHQSRRGGSCYFDLLGFRSGHTCSQVTDEVRINPLPAYKLGRQLDFDGARRTVPDPEPPSRPQPWCAEEDCAHQATA